MMKPNKFEVQGSEVNYSSFDRVKFIFLTTNCDTFFLLARQCEGLFQYNREVDKFAYGKPERILYTSQR